MNASPTAGVTILPPVDGAAPHPPVAMQSTFEALTEALAEPLALHERLGRGVGRLGRVARATLSQMPYRQRADGLSPAATERWAKRVAPRLSPLERSALLAYALDCRAWERRMHRRIGSDRADPDWDMTSAPNVAPSAPEAMFAHALEDAGIPVRAQVSVADLGGPKTLGPLSRLLEGKQELSLRGRFEILRPGHAQFRVSDVSLKELKLPSAMIPGLIARIGMRDRDSTIADNAIPVRVPNGLVDVRVGKGRITLYKSVP